ncbi:aggregation-promoting factor C-terminal-like domain-containing protein [Actinomadura fibrosa]|uniref:Lytic transglycosylase domain-containing protein n=1 Tax=Actinomadura fibrosa TaxID=111802 RepID=A0ABW2XFP0_9ACTN|nr:lytic transglycosylase domain-containing protein [Actinomadura fibrosa]
MSTHLRNALRAIALGAAAAFVAAPMATSPVRAALDRLETGGIVRVLPAVAAGHAGDRRRARAHRNKAIARSMMARHRWRSARQFRCLERLWGRESHWNERAHNAASGAHGIPQALPGSKMASAGPRWHSEPRTQIRWGLRYIRNRYGSPCAAWSHFQAAGWY